VESRPDSFAVTREKLRAQLREGHLEARTVEVEVPDRTMPTFQILGSQGAEEMDVNFRDLLPGLFGNRKKKRVLPVSEARDFLRQEEATSLVDQEQVAREAVERAESSGIVFLDEMDKIAGRESVHGPDVSREGVQRDLLPIVEGTTVSTKYGPVRTDHVLFIAAGAFHVSKPTDLIPELQGRFPIRVELKALGEEDLVRILTEPQSALVTQYRALLGTEGVGLTFAEDAVKEIARFAAQVNEQTENIGARRLATVLETLLDEVSFEAGGTSPFEVTIDGAYVRRRLEPVVKSQDLSRYIL
jgi:ATP-dependent HslUV protease ATP-binding subunit HslU